MKSCPSLLIESLHENGTRWKIRLGRWSERRATLIVEDGGRQSIRRTNAVARITCLDEGPKYHSVHDRRTDVAITCYNQLEISRRCNSFCHTKAVLRSTTISSFALFTYNQTFLGKLLNFYKALIFLAAAERPEELVVGIFDIEKHLNGTTKRKRVIMRAQNQDEIQGLACRDCSSVISSEAFMPFNSISLERRK